MHRLLSILALFICLLVFIPSANAASTEWEESKEVSLRLISGDYEEDGSILLGAHFTMAQGWKTYWRTPGDGGLPFSIDWQGSDNIAKTETKWPAPKRFVEYDNIENFAYKDEVVFPIILSPEDAGSPVNIKANVNYAVCEEICIFLQKEFSLNIEPGHTDPANKELIEKYRAKVPGENGAHGLRIADWELMEEGQEGGKIKINASSLYPFTKPDIFIEGDAAFRFPKPDVTLSEGWRKAEFVVDYTISSANTSIAGKPLTLTIVDSDKAVEKGGITLGAPVSFNIALILLFAYIGGLILNIMPCVLPVLSIKLLGIIKHGGSTKTRVRASFLSSAAGIIASFIVLALIVSALKSTGMNVGWGFHFQEPVFLIVLVLILNLFAANLWGFFEIPIPTWLGGKLENRAHTDDHTLSGHFFTGALATLLATPCSAPFLGTAIGFAFAQGVKEILITFTVMGVGLATPYLIFVIFPSLATKLPRPGMWMIRVKQIMGVLLAATSLWLIWVLSAQLGDDAALALIALSIIIFVKFWIARFFPVLQKRNVSIGLIAAIAVLSLSIPYFYGQTHKASINKQAVWQNFEENKIPTLVDEGNVVFVDVTADWCLTCKANKLLVLNTEDIAEQLSAPKTIAMKADWTSPDKKITAFMKRYGRYGIPFNIVYGPNAPEGIELPELLTKKLVMDALKKARGN